MITVEKIWESHLGGFYRYAVKRDGKISFLSSGVTLRDEDAVADHIRGLLRNGLVTDHIPLEARRNDFSSRPF